MTRTDADKLAATARAQLTLLDLGRNEVQRAELDTPRIDWLKWGTFAAEVKRALARSTPPTWNWRDEWGGNTLAKQAARLKRHEGYKGAEW